MSESLQRLVDTLAERLGRSVAIDDPFIRLICSSRHYGDADEVRIRSLIERSINGPVIDYLREQGVFDWSQPKRLSGRDDLGLRARLCFPLRSNTDLLGFMWIVDDGLLSDLELRDARSSAREALTLLEHANQLAADEELEYETLVQDCLAGEVTARRRAAADLRSLGALTGANHVSVILLVASPTGPQQRQSAQPALRSAVRRLSREGDHQGRLLGATSEDGAVILFGSRGAPRPGALNTIGLRLIEHCRRAASSRRFSVGIGEPQRSLDLAYQSFGQATQAQRVAAVDQRDVAEWAELGVEALIAAIARPHVDQHLLPSALAKLTTDHNHETLLTVRSYLDHAGAVAAVADHLHVHRTTVYYRLERFAKLSGLELEDGRTRLMLQLWFELQRFTDFS